jgi:hypothetical protein
LDLLRSTRRAASAALLALALAAPARAGDPRFSLAPAREAAAWRGPASSPVTPLVSAPLAPGGTGPGAIALTSDTLTFRPSLQYEYWDSTGAEPLAVAPVHVNYENETSWLKAPMGDELLDHPDPWMSLHHGRSQNLNLVLDYNRSDLVRYGLHFQAQRPQTMYPRIGAKLEYATGRKRTLYGIQMEQPLLPSARFVFGWSAVRRTEHPELQQVDNVENSLALLLDRTDYRDYWEREGGSVYLSWRVPDFSTVSLHARQARYRSTGTSDEVVSWFNLQKPLRPNPAIDDGDVHSVLIRLERLTQRSSSSRAGLYHWIELEKAGGQMGGDFDYTRFLGDVRSVLRLTPATTLSLRGVIGTGMDGSLPLQKRFGVGGVDGLRGHQLNDFVGNQAVLGQAEYTMGLWALRGEGFEAGLHVITFLDMGTAWDNPGNRWDVQRQRFESDGGFGLATSEDDLRLYVARDLSNPDASFVWSLRLRRPF